MADARHRDMAHTLPPAMDGSRLLGVLPDVRRDILGTLERARREQGDVVRLLAGPPRLRSTIYAIFHPDGVRQAMATEADRYRKDNRFYNEIRWALGDGLLNSQDERWMRQRRFIQPLFTRRRIAGYADAMGEEAEELSVRWRAAGDTIDLHAEMSRVTLRIVGRLLFGADVERAVPVVARVFPLLGEYARMRAYNPLRTPRSWPTPANRRAAAAREEIRSVCDELIAARPRRRRRRRPDRTADRRARRRRAPRRLGDPRPGPDLPARGPRHDGDRAHVRPAPARAAPGGAGAGPRRGRRGRRPHARRRRRRAARVHHDGAQGGDAAVPARVGLRPPQLGRRRGRRAPRAGRCRHPR